MSIRLRARCRCVSANSAVERSDVRNKTTSDLARDLEPIFLELGKSLYICQAYEGTLVLLLSLLSHEDAGGAEGAFGAAFDLYSQKTLGLLLKRLGERIEIPEELRAVLELGWERRNAIAHRFVHENISAFSAPVARIEIESRLAGYKQDVKRADILACRILDALYKKYGVSVAAFKRDADRLWDHLNPGGGEEGAKH